MKQPRDTELSLVYSSRLFLRRLQVPALRIKRDRLMFTQKGHIMNPLSLLVRQLN